MAADLLAAVRTLPRLVLTDAADAAPKSPGVYLQFAASRRPEVADLLGPLVSCGRYPLYVGSAHQSAARLRRYLQSLANLPGVDVDELHVAVLPCETAASALFAEACLLNGPVRGVMNSIGGWGSKVPGSRRKQQTSSPVDALFPPGRRWTRPPSHIDQIRARCQMIAALAAIDPSGPRWPPLIEA